MRATRTVRFLIVGIILLLTIPRPANAQTMPGPVYHSLLDQGADGFEARLEKQFEPASTPDRNEVENVLRRWHEATGGPSSDWDWLAVTRLWLRAGDADRATEALQRVGDRVPEPFRLLERARVGFLSGDSSAASFWWGSCAVATEESALEAWLDLVSLATPDELEEWNRFRPLPAAQRDDCAFLHRFLNRRAIASGQSADGRLSQHYARLRYARENYGRRGKETGTTIIRHDLPPKPVFDDRGLLYVRLGKPDRTAAYQAGPCYEPNVTWAYEDPDGIRLYHLSPLGGTDDWWLLENLASVFRCPVDPVTGQVIMTRNPMVALSPILPMIPPWFLIDLYISRAVLDPEYARMASRFDRLRTVEQLQVERNMTVADALLLIEQVPERPDLDFDLQFNREWIQFRSPRPFTTRVWVNAELRSEDVRRAVADERSATVEVVVSLLDETGGRLQTVPASFDLEIPADGSPQNVLGIRVPVEVPPGRYETLFQIRIPGDADDLRQRGNFVRDSLVVRDFGGTIPLLSDVAVSPDSGGAWQPRPGLNLRPSPAHRSGPDGLAWIYLEAYNLTPGGAFTAHVRLDKDDAGGADPSVFQQEYGGTAARGARIVTPIVLRLDLGETEPGSYALRVSVTDVATGARTLDSPATLEVSRRP
jgi:GWxTD domain-containing protein